MDREELRNKTIFEIEEFLQEYKEYVQNVRQRTIKSLIDELRVNLQRKAPLITRHVLAIKGEGTFSLGLAGSIQTSAVLASAVMGGNNEVSHNLSMYETAVSSILNSALGSIEADIWPPKENTPAKEQKQMVNPLSNNSVWQHIENDYGISKNSFARKINFIKDTFKRKIIFRDIEHAYTLAKNGFSKPAVIISGGVIEELLRQYLESNNVTPSRNDFNNYIKACEDNDLLKGDISQLSHVVREFRNYVHLSKEKSSKDTVSKATAIGAVSFIFTIANDF